MTCSKLGHLLSSPIMKQQWDNQVHAITVLQVAASDKKLKGDVDLIWRLDTIGLSQEKAQPDDKAASEQFNDSIQYVGSRNLARLLWKASHSTLPIYYRLTQILLFI